MRQKLILIGASTGGPGHLKKILNSLKSEFKTPIIIAQHMNKNFIESFVKQFDSELPLKVSMIDSRHSVCESNIYICSKHCELLGSSFGIEVNCVDGVDSQYNPSVDHLFNSAVGLVNRFDILAVLLTGIGYDGAQAMSNLQNAGAKCIAESEKSAIVFGMPKRALELNPNILALDLDGIIQQIKIFEEK
jgi:two-component system chemotaxis response regulator CheB